jgi:hypothetical protein
MSLFDRAAYRVRQLRRSLWPRVTRAERDDAGRVLGERLYPLFDSMHPADQRHCLDVYERLVAGACTDGEMLQAALIHDAGKGSIAGARFGVHHRIVYVVLQGFPSLLDGLARRNRGIRSRAGIRRSGWYFAAAQGDGRWLAGRTRRDSERSGRPIVTSAHGYPPRRIEP